jgi:hypothetical protein
MPRLLIATTLALVFISGCGGGGGDGGGNSPPPAPPPGTPAPSALSYTSPQSATAGSAITALNPTVTGTVASYAVSPALPAGLALNTTTGVISGTPTTPTAPATYTVTATNAGGNTTFALQLQVNGTGTFMDSIVSGLGFTSGNVTGTTDANGRFTYQAESNITFRVGGIQIGTVTPAALLTPLDLVSNGTGANTTVQNIVRFLLLLDSDGNPANGITISEALRGRAANWTAVDFSDTANLATALATVILDTQVDGTQRALPSAADAETHFNNTFRCMFSGYFRGTYSGDDNGRFAFTIDPKFGAMAGAAYSTAEEELILLLFSPQQLQVQNGSAFAAGLAATGSSFSGTFPTYNTVSGTWTDGTFTGERYAGTSTAAYKILTLLTVPNQNPQLPPVNIGTFFTEIDTAGAITAEAHVDFTTGQQVFDLAVTQNGNTLTIADTITGVSITGTLDLSVPTITGTFTNAQTGNSGTLVSGGCRLR